jgi:hypothetical protein
LRWFVSYLSYKTHIFNMLVHKVTGLYTRLIFNSQRKLLLRCGIGRGASAAIIAFRNIMYSIFI